MIKDFLHQQIIKHYPDVTNWFEKKSQDMLFPFYSSFDLRDSGFKISPVDANLFPAGFNNICKVDKESAVSICQKYLSTNWPEVKNIILLAEEHTQNPFYWDNIYSLKTLLEKSGAGSIVVAVPGKNIKQDMTIKSAGGYLVKVFLLENKIKHADLIISNNDFSVDYGFNFSKPIAPPKELGWRTRRKHSFFKQYNALAKQFANILQIDPKLITIKTKRFKDFQIQDSKCLTRLKEEVFTFLSELESENKTLYKNSKEQAKPFVFLKNNAGTYGLGMTTITSPQDIENWNYKIKKKLKSAKGGAKVTELIIQEGIFSNIKKEGFVAEPVIYLIGSKLAGGFLRAHKEKGRAHNLNSPGAVYRALCVSDLEIEVKGKPMENAYGWVARLGVLALAYELKSFAML